MKKKVICILFYMALFVLQAAGCGRETGELGDGGSEKKNYKEFITVDVYDEFANYQGIQSGWFAKVVKDRFNMELNIIAPNVRGGGDTLYQTRAATGNLGDLILINSSNGKFNELAKSGLIMDCTELIKNKDIMKKYGNAVVKTNELVEAEGIYAFSLFGNWDYNMMNNAKQIVCMYGYDEQGFVLAKADGSDYQDIIESDSFYIKVLRFFNEANSRGLVDPESFSQSYDAWLLKYQKGKVLYSPWPWVGQSMFHTAENLVAGKGFKMAPVKDMQIFSFGCFPDGDSTNIIAIGSEAEDPQRIADFIDWLYSPEGVEMNGQANGAAGPMGLTWEQTQRWSILRNITCFWLLLVQIIRQQMRMQISQRCVGSVKQWLSIIPGEWYLRQEKNLIGC